MNFILPLKAGEINFNENVLILSKIFGGRSSLFNTRWLYLNLVKSDDEDFATYAGLVIRECEKF